MKHFAVFILIAISFIHTLLALIFLCQGSKLEAFLYLMIMPILMELRWLLIRYFLTLKSLHTLLRK